MEVETINEDSTDAASFLIDRSSDSAIFDCNICFDLAHDPVVTLCGHLFCWPCLYMWLHFHSHAKRCPVCKSIVQEEKLVPIYGRGDKASSEHRRSRPVPSIKIPSRPSGQRPETAPLPPTITYFRQDEYGLGEGFIPMATARLWSFTRSALFSTILSLFNFQIHGFHDATGYGTTSGVPYLFWSSFHGDHANGFHQHPVHGHCTKSVLKICLLFFSIVLISLLIASSPFQS